MSEYVFCNHCGHRNPPSSAFCSSCGSPLDRLDDRTINLTRVDPLQDASGEHDDLVIPVGELPTETAVLIVRAGEQAGDRFILDRDLTRLGRHPDSSNLKTLDLSSKTDIILSEVQQYYLCGIF